MDKDLYRIMQEIYEKENQNAIKYKKFEVEDVQYMGTIETIEKINNVDTKIVKDIFKVIEKMKDGSIVENYYDEEINCVAGRNKDGQMYPSQNQIAKDINISEKIEDLQNDSTISLNEMNNLIETMAKELGVDKENILAMSQYALNQPIENKDDNDEKIKLNDDEDQKEGEGKEEQEETKKQNENALDKINGKQEIDLDKKVDDARTLGQILGVKAGSKLIAVYSDAIENNKNTTKFSFIIKNQDGTIENADMLNQAGGKNSNKKIHEVNGDGSKVEEKAVQSSYTIEGTKNSILTARIGATGRIEISYGEMDKTRSQEALTHELKTDNTKEPTYKVREEFSYKKGERNITNDLTELREAEEIGIKKPTLEDADGKDETGTLDNITNTEKLEDVVEKIKQNNPEIAETFTDEEIKRYLTKRANETGENESAKETVEGVVSELEEESKHFKTRGSR